jgi:hypothetical protein
MQGISPTQPLFAKFVSETPANTIVCERIPCAVEQGIFSRVQGISSAFWTGAGNLGKIDPRFGAQYA